MGTIHHHLLTNQRRERDVGVFLFNSMFVGVRHQLSAPTLCALRALHCSPAHLSDAIATPPLDGAPKQYSPKIQQLVSDIAGLTLLEVSDLNELLKVSART